MRSGSASAEKMRVHSYPLPLSGETATSIRHPSTPDMRFGSTQIQIRYQAQGAGAFRQTETGETIVRQALEERETTNTEGREDRRQKACKGQTRSGEAGYAVDIQSRFACRALLRPSARRCNPVLQAGC